MEISDLQQLQKKISDQIKSYQEPISPNEAKVPSFLLSKYICNDPHSHIPISFQKYSISVQMTTVHSKEVLEVEEELQEIAHLRQSECSDFEKQRDTLVRNCANLDSDLKNSERDQKELLSSSDLLSSKLMQQNNRKQSLEKMLGDLRKKLSQNEVEIQIAHQDTEKVSRKNFATTFELLVHRLVQVIISIFIPKQNFLFRLKSKVFVVVKRNKKG